MIYLLPNILTLLRIALVAPIIYAFYTEHFVLALILFIVAAISDAFDGIVARSFHSTSRFGSIADPVADKILLVSCFLLLYFFELVPWWLSVTVIARDFIIFVGALAYHYLISPYDLEPSKISKINTFIQILFISLFLVELAFQVVPGSVLMASFWIVMSTSITSGIDYIWTWGAKAMQVYRQARHHESL